MIGPVLQFEDLQEMCRPGERPRLSTVEAWAKRIKLQYTYDGKGGIVTTVDAVNACIGVRAANDSEGTYRPDEVLG